MKKIKKLKNKLMLFLLAIIFPLSATGIIFSLGNIAKVEAAALYYNSYSEEKKTNTFSNNNFSSGVTNYNIGNSINGWSEKMPENWTTAGVITTGSAFQNYSSSRFHLRNNPSTKDSDLYVLMINSKTEKSSDRYKTNQGYSSNSIKLDPNSYYYFQVSFKTDTNYDSRPNYTQRGLISEDDGLKISQTTFGYINESTIVEFGDYIQINYAGSVYYVEKKLTSTDKTLEETAKNVKIFYTDEKYVGFLYKENEETLKPMFVSKDYRQENHPNPDDEKEVTYDIISGAELFECSIVYNPSTEDYTIPYNTPYYDKTTEYISINDQILGSIYLSGIDVETDERAYVGITAKDWTTFYFFVATGNNEENVTLDLWLGSEDGGIKSSGVVFYDACHLYQCSENSFWNTYDVYERNKYYSYQIDKDSTTKEITQKCTKLIDLRNEEEIDNQNQNFDFEKSNNNPDQWIVDPERKNGEAQVFDISAQRLFKDITKHDFIGANLSCKVTYDKNKSNVVIKENKKVLALWANEGYVSVRTQKPILINANEIYKIKVNYKVTDLNENGNVYVKIKESNSIFNGKYVGLTKENYTLTAETSSTAVNSNGTSKFTNNYCTIEFYVKGGPLFDSSIDLSLALGSSSENTTGCVLFDDITITKAKTSEYSSASNKIELGSSTITTDSGILNGSFDLMTKEENPIYTPDNWTLTKEENYFGVSYSGIVNTEENQWKRYIELYNKVEAELSAKGETDSTKNPYYFVQCTSNPGTTNGNKTTNNVLMMINRNKTYQTLKSSNFTLDANSIYELNFDYYVSVGSKIRVSIFTNDGIKLFQKTENSTGNKWNYGNSKYSIYFETLKEGAVDAYIQIEFGTNEKDGKEIGQTFFDNFKLIKNENENKETEFENAKNKIKMSNYYFDLVDLPTNLTDLTPNPKTLNHPAYEGISNSSAYIAGIVKGQAFSKDHPLYAEGLKDKNVFFIGIDQGKSYSIDSLFPFDLNSSNYYTIKFKFKTSFLFTNENEDKELEYGVTIGLTGFNYITRLINNDKDYKEIIIHFKPSETTSSKLHIALVCDENMSGNMAIYDFSYEESTDTSEEYSKIVDRVNNAGEQSNEYIAEAENKTDEEENPDNNTDSDNETTPASNGNGFDWLLIPALITGLAIIIAVIGTILRKVKIKKIERKRKETYDRKESLNIDAIKQTAKKERDAEIEALQSEKDRFQNELNKLEELHKQKVLELRQKDKSKISKQTDKEFKIFAQKTSVIAEKIEHLNKQIEDVKTPEHLLSLERKIYSQEEMKKRELEKVNKKRKEEKRK